MTFPQYAETGIWNVLWLSLTDAVRNGIDVRANALIAKGLPAQISIGPKDHIPPTTTPSVAPSPNANSWNNSDVTITVTAADNPGGSGVRQITVDLTGAQTGSHVIAGSTDQFTISAEGATTVGYFATDNEGNKESAKTLTVKIDKSSPVISGLPGSGCTIWPPNHKLVQVATVSAADALSELSFLTVTGTSNDPANGQIVITGVPSQYTVQLGADKGQIYKLIATAIDLAGNITAKTATCSVPQNQGE